MTVPTPTDTEPNIRHAGLAPWILRAAALASGSTVPLLADRFDDWSNGTELLTSIALWLTWATVLLCVLVPSSVSLTALRLVAPAHLAITAIVVVADLVDGASAPVVAALVPTLLTTVVASSAEIGAFFVQASAYGDEFRVPLLPSPAFTVVLILGWTVWVGSLVAGTALVLDEAWVAGGLLLALGLACTVSLPRRFHRFARRWIVLVPAGVVLHDHVVLAETAMFGRPTIRAVTLTARSDDAADLSGRCRGTGVEVVLDDFETIVLAATPGHPGGSALHVKTWWVRPSRPGRLLSAWTTPPRRRHSPS